MPCPVYLQHVSLYFLLKMTVHIDISTILPQGCDLVGVLGSLRHSESNISREALVQEVFAPGSGVEVSALFLRFSQQLKRVDVMFDTPGHSEGLAMHIDVLSLFQELVCQPSTISMIGQHDCQKEAMRVLGHIVRDGITLDNALHTYTMWTICHNIYQ